MIDPSLGYYTVNGEVVTDKAEAVYKANLTKSEIEWYFNDDKFNSANWFTEPALSLNELYKLRAQQIRDNYDYVLVFASGGADSTNVVYSFLKNDIHIDEIVAGAPVSGLKNWTTSDKTTDAENTISETFLTQIPFLQKIKNQFPNVKVTLHDYFEDMISYKTDEWLFNSSCYIHPTFAARYNLERYDHIKKIADSGKRIALVYGLDKPQIAKKNNSFYSVIFDHHVSNAFRAIKHDFACPVMFYYTPELPELLIKQAHVTCRFLELKQNQYLLKYLPFNEDYQQIYETIEFEKAYHSGIYERAIIPAIYPMLDETLFQCNKPRSIFMGQHDDWLSILHPNSRLVEMINSDFTNYIKNIDEKYLNYYKETGRVRGFKHFRKAFKFKKL